MKRVCVYCGTNAGRRPEYGEAARTLGTLLAERGYGLVYGGAQVGLMGVLADATLQGGGEVIGVMPNALLHREHVHRYLTELRIVESMHERKALMSELADAFVALPGALGTLDELFEILTWAQLGLHAKPCGLLNVHGYFAGLLAFLDHAVGEGFLRSEYRALLMAADTPGELLERLSGFEAPSLRQWIERGDI